jgi:hypothetical protein
MNDSSGQEWVPVDTFGARLALIRQRMQWNVKEAADRRPSVRRGRSAGGDAASPDRRRPRRLTLDAAKPADLVAGGLRRVG